ncbi:pyruvate ferredoxin oxidoreductase delta subunit [Lachnospiraceae bacterium]|jgi:pyruvate ferredoxin oxidoreductase delta subunit|nr:pyruvate ferredoxin oxidoreductase delta subunit [Lachnospiraceae bacterium]
MANKERLDISNITEKSPYQDITPGNAVYGGGGATAFNTGEWRTQTPVVDWDKCVQCLLCAPMCPDSSIPVKDGKRLDFDLDHCKGCGICAGCCSFGAITMKEGL